MNSVSNRLVACAALGIGLLALSDPGHPDAGDRVPGIDAESGKVWLGNLLLFAAVLCEAAYSVIGKRLTERLGPKQVTSMINLWGLVLFTPAGLYLAWHFDFGAVRWPMWLLLVFYALAACMWSVWLWMTGLKVVPAAQGGVFTVMLPISAAMVGILVLGEPLGNAQGLALAIALAGVVLATLPARQGR